MAGKKFSLQLILLTGQPGTSKIRTGKSKNEQVKLEPAGYKTPNTLIYISGYYVVDGDPSHHRVSGIQTFETASLPSAAANSLRG